ncbi:TonB-dependent receptor plug domain-containing protein [Formosa sp. PL04]|uniref:TonB-dependent receptor plug domain-containing protein n=1 Tax=Formosa sp. PL04 TaxID=3081755 RepID=UPI0029818314|nr:TonB-dependent receptor [Formosa sp. PL04]MDW5288258.1 carboxypeptidase-like regulatory domain-containing protein [Formosa sp. PL04]
MKIFIFIVGLLLPYVLSSQHISGTIINNNNEPLVGASVHWKNTAIGTITDIDGHFKLTSKNISEKTLIASYVGHTSETLNITDQTVVNFTLYESESLNEVVIKSKRDGVIISSLSPIKTELITKTELAKAACCDLAGCFETQTTVQAQTTNVVTNSKELRILGLSGVYNQVLINGFPMIQGLTYTYGISSIPGTLVDNIYISKGANSVLQGYEGISGQINVETIDPNNTDMLLLNAYINSFAEKHFNANYAFTKGKWSNITAVSTVQPANDFDKDHDTFLDVAKLTRYMVFNNLSYGNEAQWGWSGELGLRFVNEQRIGGQTFFDPETDKGSHEVYGQTVNYNQPEIWARAAYRLNDQHNLLFQASSFYQNQNSYFGTVKYDAEQTNFYANLQYEFIYDANILKTGVSFRHLNINEEVAFTYNSLQRTYAGDYYRNENVVGVFAENTMTLFDGKLNWILGLRVDNHNVFGTKVTPRTLLKYDITPKTIIRANIGTGWRTVNLFSENIGLLVSSRDIIFKEELLPEQALNTGINFTQKFDTPFMSGFFSADYYHTNFTNQVFPDYDTDPTKAYIGNFTGKSVSNVFQAEVSLNFWQQLDFKIGYSFLDVYRIIDGQKEVLPFNPNDNIVTSLGFNPRSNKFRIDMNFHWYGVQRLPDTQSNPIEFRRPDYSEDYSILNAQFTYNLNSVELYAGCENIFDFRQDQPILSWEDPFGEYFDTSSVWGPTRGREFYLGVRYKIPGK